MKILVVDDAQEIRVLLKKYLEEAGYNNLDFAASSQELLKTIDNYDLNAGELDLILLDVVLPDGNGIEICSQLKNKKSFQDIPIIMVTAKDEESTLQEAFSAGAMDYIKKPISKVELLV